MKQVFVSQFKEKLRFFQFFRHKSFISFVYNIEDERERGQRMREKILIAAMLLLAFLIQPQMVFAEDIEDLIMDNVNQDILMAGKVSHVSEDYIVLKVTDYINVELSEASIEKREEDHRYVIPRDGTLTYEWSYHEKENVEEGDCVVASLKKINGKWKISHGLFEVDSDNYQTLSFEPFQWNLTFPKTKLKYFINSDGRLKNFSSNENATEFYYKNRKIYDTRWNLKKYLTVEEITNAEKLKAMNQKANVKDQTSKNIALSEIKRKILFAVDLLLIIGLVAILKKRSPKNNEV